jgi:hypothetical protein
MFIDLSTLTKLQADARYVQPATSPSFTGVTATAGGQFISVGLNSATLRLQASTAVGGCARWAYNLNATGAAQEYATYSSWLEQISAEVGIGHKIDWYYIAPGGVVAFTTPIMTLLSTGALTTTALAATGATGIALGTNVAGGSVNIPGYLKLWSAGDNAYYSDFITGTQSANCTYTLPTALGAGFLRDVLGNGTLSWAAIDLSAYAALAGAAFTGGVSMAKEAVMTKQTITSTAGAAAIDWRNGNKAVITLTENTTITFTAPTSSANLVLVVKQNGTGGWTLALPTMKWPGGTAFTITATASAVDIISIYYDASAYYAVGNNDLK